MSLLSRKQTNSDFELNMRRNSLHKAAVRSGLSKSSMAFEQKGKFIPRSQSGRLGEFVRAVMDKQPEGTSYGAYRIVDDCDAVSNELGHRLYCQPEIGRSLS